MAAPQHPQHPNATRKVSIRLTPEEYLKIQAAFERTTKRKLSEYIRFVLLEKPVTVYTRSYSMDAFVVEMIKLRTELSAIGNNLNQGVKRLHTMEHFTEVKLWLIQNKIIIEILLQKITEIKEKMGKISDAWLQE